ncbi:calmodulin-like 3 [Bonamia ostreae]|uniref:Calmodulin-like 3 n=1 Tax=Bonamia ostreae TaxID=126728 RepID=A0ABV2ARQ4_9EUKA
MDENKELKKVDEIKEAFELFDKNGDGTISALELGQVLRSLGQNPTESELNDMISEFDSNGKGNIDFEDFKRIISTHKSEFSAKSNVKEAFKAFDKDGNGFISLEELKSAMESLGEKVTKEELQEMVKIADKNNDGKIDYEEFVEIMQHEM